MAKLVADWRELKERRNDRYPMSDDRRVQLDCRVTSCKYYRKGGQCFNVSPALTLNEGGEFVCWTRMQGE